MTDPNGASGRPKSLREAGRRVWLETINLLAEYGTLVVFSALAAGAETVRQSVALPTAANVAVIAAEAVTALTMITPKAIRAVGEVIQMIGITLHEAGYALRHGERRPKAMRGDKT